MYNQYDLMLGISNYSPNLEQDLVRTFISRRVDAIVLIGGNHTQKTITMLENFSFPVIQFGVAKQTK